MQRPHIGWGTECAGCRHKIKYLNTKQKVYFYIKNIYIETIVFIYTVYTRKLGTYTVHSMTHLPILLMYPINILEFY